jgi:hypothetical protein
MQLTVENLKRLGSCWTTAQLEEAAKSWPTVATWAWFIGPRLHDMVREEAMLRVQLALKAIAFDRTPAPLSPGALSKWLKTASDSEFAQCTDALGAWLDATGDGELYSRLATILAEAPGIVEVAP